ncbi:MAG: spermidine synthase [Sporichthyaceae bacterium]
MGARFEELDFRPTPMGELSLRRRLDPATGVEIHEVKLDEDFLMSSLFVEAEIAISRIALDLLPGTDLDVAVGGLGLGFTAVAVLDDARVRSLIVLDALPEIIEWNRRGLIPNGVRLAADERCRLVHADFFAAAASPGLDPDAPERRFDAIVVDIDHSPSHWLHPSHGAFYTPAGLARLRGHLRPGGVFTLWSNDPPESDFLALLAAEFPGADAEVVSFANPLQDRLATNTVYVATAAP